MATESTNKQGKRRSEDEILKVLKKGEGGASTASVARAHWVTDHTIYRWRANYAGMNGTELHTLRELPSENHRMNRIVARQALEIGAYKEVGEGKW